ncbi:PREDICTED: probable E3 ubiquitin-protein ligase ARI3 isoform X2 [Camelina sativa]|nr:PREDICTED: probable E3 ubiquitin-protein ligase ARI3 isoform X2 [Camelina sativa]
MEEQGALLRARKSLYRLYFKGLVIEETTVTLAGFGVAICGDKDDLVFDMKGPIHDPSITVLEAELIALKCGLKEAVSMQIKDISICCDDDQIFELVMGRSTPEQESIALLMRDVQGIRKYLRSSIPVMLTRNHDNFAYEFAIEAILEMPVPPAQKENCSICMKDDINADQMFHVAKCGHMFCSDCVRSHIEARLSTRYKLRCPGIRCKSPLTYGHCVNILTPELKEKWEKMINEDLIPVTDRVYCPNPRCSALMSVADFSGLMGVRRSCVKCGKPFCINCKVPWHINLSCRQYKRLHPNPTENDGKLRDLANEERWRQCRKCQHMIERSSGCPSMICRCGHNFCYHCGGDAGLCYHGHDFSPPRLRNPTRIRSPTRMRFFFGCF